MLLFGVGELYSIQIASEELPENGDHMKDDSRSFSLASCELSILECQGETSSNFLSSPLDILHMYKPSILILVGTKVQSSTTNIIV